MSENNEGRFSVDQSPANELHEVDNAYDIDAYNESVYTPYELARLRAFENILTEARAMEDRLKNGAPMVMNWTVKDKEGKIKSATPMWSDSWENVWARKQAAWHMYTGGDTEINGEIKHTPGLIDSEKMRDAANMVLNGFREDAANAAKFEVLELDNIWKED